MRVGEVCDIDVYVYNSLHFLLTGTNMPTQAVPPYPYEYIT